MSWDVVFFGNKGDHWPYLELEMWDVIAAKVGYENDGKQPLERLTRNITLCVERLVKIISPIEGGVFKNNVFIKIICSGDDNSSPDSVAVEVMKNKEFEGGVIKQPQLGIV